MLQRAQKHPNTTFNQGELLIAIRRFLKIDWRALSDDSKPVSDGHNGLMPYEPSSLTLPFIMDATVCLLSVVQLSHKALAPFVHPDMLGDNNDVPS